MFEFMLRATEVATAVQGGGTPGVGMATTGPAPPGTRVSATSPAGAGEGVSTTSRVLTGLSFEHLTGSKHLFGGITPATVAPGGPRGKVGFTGRSSTIAGEGLTLDADVAFVMSQV